MRQASPSEPYRLNYPSKAHLPYPDPRRVTGGEYVGGGGYGS